MKEKYRLFLIGFICLFGVFIGIGSVDAVAFEFYIEGNNVVKPNSSIQLKAIEWNGNDFGENQGSSEEDRTSDAIWTSSNESVATINNGLLSGISEGTTNIKACYQGNYGEYCTDDFKVTVSTAYNHIGQSGSCYWKISNNGLLNIYSTYAGCSLGEPINVGIGMDIYRSPWYDYADDITSISFSNAVYANSNSSYLFSGLENVTDINFSGLDTSYVTNMAEMFEECSSLTSLDLSNFNTSNVTNMMGMFSFTNSLNSINLSNFNTSNVTNMSSMFALSGVSSLDLSSFNTRKVTSMDMMFAAASNLRTIKVSNLFTTEHVTLNSELESGLFEGCTSLVGGKGTTYDETKIGLEYARIDTCDQKGYFTSNEEQDSCEQNDPESEQKYNIGTIVSTIGNVNANVSEAKAGDVITIKTIPTRWYKLNKIIIYNKNHKDITNRITFLSMTSFIMPNYDIFVNGDFVPNYKESVSNFKAQLNSYKSVSLSWGRAGNAKNYELCYKKSSDSNYKCNYKGSLKGVMLEPGTKYDFKITPYVKDEGSSSSDPVESLMISPNYKKVSIYTLKKMNAPKVKKSSKKKVKVSFSNINGASGYEIAYSKKKNKSYKIKNLANTKNQIILKVKKNKKMYYKVRAYKIENGKKIYAPWSSIKSYKLK